MFTLGVYDSTAHCDVANVNEFGTDIESECVENISFFLSLSRRCTLTQIDQVTCSVIYLKALHSSYSLSVSLKVCSHRVQANWGGGG